VPRESARLGGKIMLVLSKDGTVRRQARVVWQEGRNVRIQVDRRYSGRTPPRELRQREVAWV
jgi:hypothetical protein